MSTDEWEELAGSMDAASADLSERRAVAAYCLLIQSADFSLVELAALNNAVQSFPRVNPQNMAFAKARAAWIIEEDGRFHDLLRDAVAVEFLRRNKAEAGGTAS